MDPITLSRIRGLHPAIATEVESILNSLPLNPGTEVRITQGFRTFEEQNTLYSQGRTKPGSKVTNASGGQSIHNYGLAFDYVLFKNGKISWEVDADWKKVATTFKSKGFEWGGDWKSFKDYPHLEKTFSLDFKAMLKKYNAGDFIPGTHFIRI